VSEKKEYIERGAARAAVYGRIKTQEVYDVINDLDAIPAADVEPVVRCRDCKYGIARCRSSIFCAMLHFYHREDFYCFYGAHMERSGSGE